MLNFHDRPVRLCDGLSRREWLRVGSLGTVGLSLPQLLQAREQAPLESGSGSFGRAKACIVIFLVGGPPQHETWDPKPDAPVEIRGPFAPIATRTPGMHVGELMPRTAQLTDQIAVLRAVATGDNAHSSSGYWMLTGQPHVPMNSENAPPGFPNDAPSLGGIVRRLRTADIEAGRVLASPLPPAITLPQHIFNTNGTSWPGQDAGFLGQTHDPWLLSCYPQRDDFSVPGFTLPGELPALRFDHRRALLDQVNQRFAEIEQRLERTATQNGRWDRLNQQAYELITSSRGRAAFALDKEPPEVRERYGLSRFGQSVLLSRRLVEAGATLVQVNWSREPEEPPDNPVWDTHTHNASRLKEVLMPPMDLAYSALLEDLKARGMLDETLVVLAGEFGRSPRINPLGGRDHWGYVFSLALAGGGVQGGVVHGASDAIGGYPREGLVRPQDLTATMFHLLGYHPETEMTDRLGRPLPISRGEVLRPLLV